MHKAKIVLLEAAVRSAGAINRREAAQALGFQDAVDRVSIEMRQKVGHHEGQVIERKAGRTPQGADNGPLFFCCFPGQLMRAARRSWQSAAQTIASASLARRRRAWTSLLAARTSAVCSP